MDGLGDSLDAAGVVSSVANVDDGNSSGRAPAPDDPNVQVLPQSLPPEEQPQQLEVPQPPTEPIAVDPAPTEVPLQESGSRASLKAFVSEPAAPPPRAAPPQGRRPIVRQKAARPQCNRFLKETLIKLSEDSARVGRKLLDEDCESWSRSPSPPPGAMRPGTAGYGAGGVRYDVPLALPDQVEYLTSWPSQARPGSSESKVFRGETPSTAATTGLGVESIITEKLGPLECGISDVRNAMLAVANVISTWARDTSNAANMWGKHMDEQYERYSANNDRWDALQKQVTSLEAQLTKLQETSDTRAEVMHDFRNECRDNNSRVERALSKLDSDLQQAASQSEDRIVQVKSTLAGTPDAVTENVRRLIYGHEDDHEAKSTAISPQIQALVTGLQELQKLGHQDLAEWQEASRKLQSAQELAASEVELARKLTSQCESRVEELQEEVQTLKDKLAETEGHLEAKSKAPIGASLEYLKAIEKRGRLKVNRQTGLVEVPNALEFAAVKVGQASADWKDPTAAAAALEDLAELHSCFDGPIMGELRLRPGKGGKPDFWDKVAAVQSEFLKESLKKAGIPEMLLMMQGQQAAKNQEPGITFTLKRDVFDDAAVAAMGAAVDTGGAGKKPAGKR